MKRNDVYKNNTELTALCGVVRGLIDQQNYHKGKALITQAMAKYPHAPEPHNLMGILLENEGDHLTALKHFRAAWDLDPAYLPARYNLNQYADMFSKKHRHAYVAEDCTQEQDSGLKDNL